MDVATVATLLDQNLRGNGIPILGVSMGNATDRSTWKVQYDPAATAAQLTQGESIRSTFDPTAPSVTAAALDIETNSAIAQRFIKATCALITAVKLGRPLQAGDGPAVQATFADWKTYYHFIANNNL